VARKKKRRSRVPKTTDPKSKAAAKQTAPEAQGLEALHRHRYDPDSGCFICRTERPFELPERVVQACIDGELVIFAGAGVSTESPIVLPWTLYSDTAADVGIDPETGVPFPTVLSRYEAEHGRPALLQRVKERLDYIDAFPDLRVMATRFHRELGTLFYVQDILTTNWDTYFESECGAVPIVTADDYAFWNLPGRKVFKVHGSMNNVGSIIATERDYEACYARLREGVMGSSLKHLLATKTILFVGYSFRDEDFNQIYSLVRDELGKMLPRPIIVTLDSGFDAAQYPDSEVIVTDATHFLTELKAVVRKRNDCLLDDERFDGVVRALMLTEREHARLYDRFTMKQQPLIVYAGMYQDGLDDGLERMLNLRGAGVYSHTHQVANNISTYEKMRSGYSKRKNYFDVAYTEGYIAAMTYLLADDAQRELMPLYYVFGSHETIRDIDTFARIVEEGGETLHKTAYQAALKLAERTPEGVIVHHRASLSPP
jgi:SIR2-like domain